MNGNPNNAPELTGPESPKQSSESIRKQAFLYLKELRKNFDNNPQVLRLLDSIQEKLQSVSESVLSIIARMLQSMHPSNPSAIAAIEATNQDNNFRITV